MGIGVMAALASCSKDNDQSEDLKFSDKAIRFTASVPYANESRQLETTNSLSEFRTWGFVDGAIYLDDLKVTKTDNAWTYSPTQYWPVGKTMNFYSLAPTNINEMVNEKQIGSETTLYGYRNNGTTDFLYAVNKDQSETNQVHINFRHALSQLKFNVKVAEGSTYYAQVSSLEIHGTRNTGDFTLPTATTIQDDLTQAVGTWSTDFTFDQGAITVYKGTPVKVENKSVAFSKEGNYEFTVPCTIKPYTSNDDGTYVKLHVAFYSTTGDHLIWPKANAAGYTSEPVGADIIVPLTKEDNYKWVSGHCYNYNITLSVPEGGESGATPISFKVTVDEIENFTLDASN